MTKWNNMELTEAFEVLGFDPREQVTPEKLSAKYRAAARAVAQPAGRIVVPGSDDAMVKVNQARDLLELMLVAKSKRGGVASFNPFGKQNPLTEKTLENKFQGEVIAAWEKIGALILNVHGHGFQKAGWPDLQVYHRLWTGHLELKVEDNQPSDLQRIVIDDLTARGTWAYVLRLRLGIVTLEDARGKILGEISNWKVAAERTTQLVRLLTQKGI